MLARLLFLVCLVTGVLAAQSAPPRKDIPAIAKAANGVIVSIITSDKGGHPVAQGTGFLVSADGRIVTNYHVIEGATSAIVKLPDGAFYDVEGVVAFDKARDLAVIKAHGQNFHVVILGNSDRVQVGEEIVAIGSPLSLESTVSSGIVSGIRTIKEEGGKFLQITAPISPGSSGGPLFNMAGEVVGITTLYLKGGENLNFAIPVNDAKLLLATGSKVQDFPVETLVVKSETHVEALPRHWQYVNTHTPSDVWADEHFFYEHLVEMKPPFKTETSCTVLRGDSFPWIGSCNYNYFWSDSSGVFKNAPNCTVSTVEIITSVSTTAVSGRSQHVDFTPLQSTPSHCPVAGTEYVDFALVPASQSESVQARTPTQPVQAQTPDAAKVLNWISGHMGESTTHTMPGVGVNGTTAETVMSSSISFRGCQVTVYWETVDFTKFKSGEKWGGGSSMVTWGPFDLSNLRPDKIGQTPDTMFQPPGVFLQIEAINAIPVVQTGTDAITGGASPTTSAMRSALRIWFASADLEERQEKAWHDAIVECGGKKTQDDLY